MMKKTSLHSTSLGFILSLAALGVVPGLSPATGLWSFLGTQQLQAQEHTKDSLATVKENLDKKKAVLWDVREANEWSAGHLKAASSKPLSQLSDEQSLAALIKDLKKDQIIYCHCKAGRRAITAAEILRKQGFDVRPLKQGYDQLLEAGFER
ncbi:MAG: rhodanese-like domain-containing protein [Planctomycetota bacterium]